jgi:outer membrane protein TolC
MFSIRANLTRTLLVIGLGLAAVFAPCGVARGSEDAVKGNEKVRPLLQAKIQTAREMYNVRIQAYKVGAVSLDRVLEAGRLIVAAELDLLDKKGERVAACEKNLELCTETKKMADIRQKVGQGTAGDVLEAECERLDAAILLEKEKAK